MITRYYSTTTTSLFWIPTSESFCCTYQTKIQLGGSRANFGLSKYRASLTLHDFKTQDSWTTPLTLIMMPVSTLSWTGIARNSLAVTLLSLDTKGAMMCDMRDYFKLSETRVHPRVDIKGIRRKCTWGFDKVQLRWWFDGLRTCGQFRWTGAKRAAAGCESCGSDRECMNLGCWIQTRWNLVFGNKLARLVEQYCHIWRWRHGVLVGVIVD